MDHLLRVTLDKSTDPWSVDVDEHGNPNHVDRSPLQQTIAWELEGDAHAGELLPVAWLDPPPPAGVFGMPELASNGKRMTMSDLNEDAATSGSWDYRLSLNLGGQQYSTRSTLPVGTNTNPSIKNN
jgi:hypothetical protein